MARPISPEDTAPGAAPTGGAGTRSTAALIFHSLRPEQWTKNLIVFAGLIFGLELFNRTAVVRSLLAFAVFCALSGVVYIVNDIMDREADRRHPLKAKRPIASGALSPVLAGGVAAALAAVALAAAFALGVPFGAVALCVSAAAVRLLGAAQAHRHPRRAGDCHRVRAARGGRGGRDPRPDQPLAAGGDHPAGALPRAEQAAPRTAAARRRRHRSTGRSWANTAPTCSTR